jgi:hypothetical protein
MTQPRTAEELAAEQVAEWNTYAAAYPIDFYGQRAYNTGDRVPVSATKSGGGWIPDELVTRLDDAPPPQTSPPPEPPPIDPASVGAPAVSSPDAVVDLTPDEPATPDTSTPQES